MRSLRSMALVATAAVATLLLMPPRATHAAPDDRTVPFALAVSGGISLGSYEAGLNWVLVRYLKNLEREGRANAQAYPELVAVAGSSAGSINAFLSALTWCLDDARAQGSGLYRDTLDDNLFREAWLGIGIDTLLPADPAGYLADDGLLSRKSFQPVIQRIERLLTTDLYRADCRIPIGITVFRVDPQKMAIAGIEPQNQRFVVPLALETRPAEAGRQRAELVSRPVSPDDAYLGNHIVLPGHRVVAGGRRHVVDTHGAMETLLTSSAFPLAFGRKRLDYCAPAAPTEDAQAFHCPPGYRRAQAEFVDGGMFDNIPLGLARELAEPKPTDPATRARWLETGRRFNYIFIDPDNRRPAPAGAVRAGTGAPGGTTPEPAEMTFGLRSQLRFLGGLLVSRGHFELYDVLRSGEWTSQTSVYVLRLATVVHERFPGVAPDVERAARPPAAPCERLFAAELPARRLDAGLAQRALDCIGTQFAWLEFIYSDTGAVLPAAQITRQRNTLIDWMLVLANRLDAGQLALSIATIRPDKLGDRRILLTTRFAPLTGSMIANFGAFIDQAFREFDYYAGVYDAAHGIATYLCQYRPGEARCLAEETRKVYLSLAVGDSAAARTVFARLATLEHPDYTDPTSPWQWLAAPAAAAPAANMQAIFTAITEHGSLGSEHAYEPPAVGDFIRALLEHGFDASDSSAFMQRIVRLRKRDELSWYYPLSSRLASRALVLEERERAAVGGGEVIGSTLALGALAAHSYIKQEERFTLNQSSAPSDSLATLLPYEIAVDARNGGLDVSWEPALALMRERLSLNFKITPVEFNRFAKEEYWFTHLDVFLVYRRTGLFSSFGIGPTYTWTWNDWPGYQQSNLGVSVFVGLLQDKLRLTAGVVTFDPDNFPGDRYYVNFGLTDIPGIAYWASGLF